MTVLHKPGQNYKNAGCLNAPPCLQEVEPQGLDKFQKEEVTTESTASDKEVPFSVKAARVPCPPLADSLEY